MSSLTVVLDFQGDLERGFNVLAMIGPENSRPHTRTQGRLPANERLADVHVEWHEAYERFYSSNSLRAIKIISASRNIDRAGLRQQCVSAAEQLVGELNHWLTSNTFWDIQQSLLTKLTGQMPARIILCSDDERLWQLPWHEWSLFKEFPQATISFSQGQYNQTDEVEFKKPSKHVKVLACLAEDSDIDTEPDKRYLSEALNAKILERCDRIDMGEHLWGQPWDVMVFSGHSRTEGGKGNLFIYSEDRADDNLDPNEFKRTLQKSVSQGLKLVVFNSCQGVGLARQLQKMNVPHVVIMRESIPDAVAHKFLEYFFNAFKGGESLDAAIESARGQLEQLDYKFPCASWLPVVWQSPATQTLTWKKLKGISSVASMPPMLRWQKALKLWCITLVVLIVILGIRHFGLLQPWELSAYDRLMRLRPASHGIDEKVIVIAIDEKDIEYQQEQNIAGASYSSISDQALLKLLLKIEPHAPRVIGLDIHHNSPFEDALINHLEKNQSSNFVAMCRHGSSNTPKSLPLVKAPANFPTLDKLGNIQVGFTDNAMDQDFVARRQSIAEGPVAGCDTTFSLSTVLALRYFDNLVKDKHIDRQGKPNIQIGTTILPRILANFGGYNLPANEVSNYQLMINYRKNNPEKISLRQLLKGDLDENLDTLFNNKVVLIGRDDGKNDHYKTPLTYGWSSTSAGVMIHAQMVSQIISYVSSEDLPAPYRRNLMSSWTEFNEYIWISLWIVTGVVLSLFMSTFWNRLVAIAISVSILYGLGLLFISNHYWVPVIAPMVGFIFSFTIASFGAINSYAVNSNQ